MSNPKDVKFSLKVMINKQKNKVLFAEANSEFIDVLLSFLAMPLLSHFFILHVHYEKKAGTVLGSITTLYEGLVSLDTNCVFAMCGYANEIKQKSSLLRAECVKLKLNIHKYFDIRKRPPSVSKTEGVDDVYGGVFTVNTIPFIISDDLQIEPVVPGSLLQTLVKFGITDTDGAELRNFTLGFNEIVDFLKGSLLSKTPLTDLVFPENCKMDSDSTGSLPLKVEKGSSSNSKKIAVKVVVQKSKYKVLFAEAGVDFINFISSFLTIPLGGIEYISGNNTCLNNIDNLYRSVANIDGDKYLKTQVTKSMLLGHIPENQMSSFHTNYLSPVMFPKSTKKVNVTGQSMYLVTDDLTVTPFCMASSFSIISDLKVPLSDVNEMEIEIGFEEAMSIFRASLTSTSALTNGLMTHLSM